MQCLLGRFPVPGYLRCCLLRVGEQTATLPYAGQDGCALSRLTPFDGWGILLSVSGIVIGAMATGSLIYCEHGDESWTSVYLDTEDPHRLAKAREQMHRLGESDCRHSDCIPTLAATGDKSQQPVPAPQPHTL
jgi:hypothetical protein